MIILKSKISKEVEQYSNRLFPKEIKRILYALANENRQAILGYLFKVKNEATFSEIARALSIKKNKLSYHLKILLNAGLVMQELAVKEAKARTFYSLTGLGKYTIETAPALFIPRESILSELRQKKKQPKITAKMWLLRDLDNVINDINRTILWRLENE